MYRHEDSHKDICGHHDAPVPPLSKMQEDEAAPFDFALARRNSRGRMSGGAQRLGSPKDDRRGEVGKQFGDPVGEEAEDGPATRSLLPKSPRPKSSWASFSAAEVDSLLALVGEHGRKWRRISGEMERLGYAKRSADSWRNKFDDLAPQGKQESSGGNVKTTYIPSTATVRNSVWTPALDALLLHLTRTCTRQVTRQRHGDVVDWPAVAKGLPGWTVAQMRTRRAALVKEEAQRKTGSDDLLGQGGTVRGLSGTLQEAEDDNANKRTPAMDALVEAALSSPRASPASFQPKVYSISESPSPPAPPSAASPAKVVYVPLPFPPPKDQPRLTLTFQGQALRTVGFKPLNRLPTPLHSNLSSCDGVAAATDSVLDDGHEFPYFLPSPFHSSPVSPGPPAGSALPSAHKPFSATAISDFGFPTTAQTSRMSPFIPASTSATATSRSNNDSCPSLSVDSGKKGCALSPSKVVAGSSTQFGGLEKDLGEGA
ncbi:hypothetical protein JCM11251_007956 [Rhodosporidiobolus azoricus]